MKRSVCIVVAVACAAVLAACGQVATPGSAKPSPAQSAMPRLSATASPEWFGMGPSVLAMLPGGVGWLSIEVGKKNWSKAWLYKTVDGGQTWQPIPVAGLSSVGYFRLFDAAHAVLLDEAGSAVFSTDDAGTNWSRYRLPAPADGTVPASFISTSEGWALISGDTGATTLYHTGDRGSTWEKVQVPASYVYPGSVFFRDSFNGWLGHQGQSAPELFETIDGGRTWKAVVLAAPPNYPGIVSFVGPVRANGGVLFTQVSVGEGSQAVGSPESTYIYSSTDNGAHWSDGVRVASGPTLNDGQPLIDVVSPTRWLVATTGELRVSVDGGLTWTTDAIDPVPGFLNNDLSFATAAEGYLLRGRSVNYGACLRSCFNLERTTDGGASWQFVNFPELPADLTTP
jgi:photosystem II stability/assembly factor-like uncharacterized protein